MDMFYSEKWINVLGIVYMHGKSKVGYIIDYE